MFGPLFTIFLIKWNRLMFTQLSEYDFLPPSKEVWGKVMFSQVFVWPRRGASAIRRLGVCIQGGVCIGGWAHSGTRKAGSTHPIGIISCFRLETILPQWGHSLRKRWILDVWLHRCVQRNVLRRRYECTSMLKHEVNRNSLWVERCFVFLTFLSESATVVRFRNLTDNRIYPHLVLISPNFLDFANFVRSNGTWSSCYFWATYNYFH